MVMMRGLLAAVGVLVGCVPGSTAQNCGDSLDAATLANFNVTTRCGTVDSGNFTFETFAAPAPNVRAVFQLYSSQPFWPETLDLTFDNVKELRISFITQVNGQIQDIKKEYNVTGDHGISLSWDSSVGRPFIKMVVNGVPEARGNDTMLHIGGLAVCTCLSAEEEPTTAPAMTTSLPPATTTQAPLTTTLTETSSVSSEGEPTTAPAMTTSLPPATTTQAPLTTTLTETSSVSAEGEPTTAPAMTTSLPPATTTQAPLTTTLTETSSEPPTTAPAMTTSLPPATTTEAPLTSSTLPPRVYIGCFRDPMDGWHFEEETTEGMSLDICGPACKSRGFTYYGVSANIRCDCGGVPDSSRQMSDSRCPMYCFDDPSRKCGNFGGYISVYTGGV